jgi:PIN domain nuclease of toxin-antitoxin system
MVLPDTPVFVWLAEDSAKLGPRARHQVHVPAITCWELGMQMQFGPCGFTACVNLICP